MKKLIVLNLFVLMGFEMSAQIIDPKEAVKSSATDRTNGHISNGVDKGLDKIESGIGGIFKKKHNKPESNATPTETPVAAGADSPSSVDAFSPDISDDIKSLCEKFWIDDEAALKKILATPDDTQASTLLDKMDKELNPRFEKLIEETTKWNKTHSKSEQAEFSKWSENNPHLQAIKKIQGPQLMMKRGSAFQQAYERYQKDWVAAGKRGMMAAR